MPSTATKIRVNEEEKKKKERGGERKGGKSTNRCLSSGRQFAGGLKDKVCLSWQAVRDRDRPERKKRKGKRGKGRQCENHTILISAS